MFQSPGPDGIVRYPESEIERLSKIVMKDVARVAKPLKERVAEVLDTGKIDDELLASLKLIPRFTKAGSAYRPAQRMLTHIFTVAFARFGATPDLLRYARGSWTNLGEWFEDFSGPGALRALAEIDPEMDRLPEQLVVWRVGAAKHDAYLDIGGCRSWGTNYDTAPVYLSVKQSSTRRSINGVKYVISKATVKKSDVVFFIPEHLHLRGVDEVYIPKSVVNPYDARHHLSYEQMAQEYQFESKQKLAA